MHLRRTVGQSAKDWEQHLLPHPPHLVSCVSGGRTTQQLAVPHTYETMCTALCSTQPPWLAIVAATVPREKKLRSRRWPVGREASTHRVPRRPDRSPPIWNARRHPGTQMRRPRAGARRCTRASPVRRDRMWSLPIIPAPAYILLINSLRRVNESVGSCHRSCWDSCGGGDRESNQATSGATDRLGRTCGYRDCGWMRGAE